MKKDAKKYLPFLPPKPISANLSLLRIGGDAKTTKGQKTQGVLTGILYLAPATNASRVNVCSHKSKGCELACLYSAGHGKFSNVQNARINKTLAYLKDRQAFVEKLVKDVEKLVKVAAKHKMQPAVRLNGTSDLPWEKVFPMEQSPQVKFYDYTKNPVRLGKFLKGEMPANYHLTFSRSETNEKQALALLPKGATVAVVFATKRGEALPAKWKGFDVIDADVDDVRYKDKPGLIAGLRAKGDALKDASGFVVQDI